MKIQNGGTVELKAAALSFPKTDGSRRGQALVEATFLAPMMFMLFLGMVNFGFFVYAFITTGNAARVAAQATASSAGAGNAAIACESAMREMRSLPNVAPLALGNCVAPLVVTATLATENFGDGTSAPYSRVTVSYDTIQLFPLPFLSGKMKINRTAKLRIM